MWDGTHPLPSTTTIRVPSGAQREDVIQYVFARYGRRGAAMTANVITYRTRLAVREMGKVLGLAPDAVDKLAKVLTTLELREGLDETRALLRQGGVRSRCAARAPPARSRRSRARPAAPSRPALGWHVISAGRLERSRAAPTRAAMAGRPVVQWDKDDCADLGIVKNRPARPRHAERARTQHPARARARGRADRSRATPA